jgi:PAS domain S-box-containing protein
MLSFIGYLSDTANLYGWGEGLSGMSVHTSIGFMLLGAAWLVMIRTRVCSDQHGLLTPLSVGLSIMIATMVSSSTLYRIEQDRRRLVIARDMQQITDLVQHDFQQRSRTIDYASSGWDRLQGEALRERWDWIIGDLLDEPDVLSVSLLDSQGSIFLRDGDSSGLTRDFASGELTGDSWTAPIPDTGGRYLTVVPLSEESTAGAVVFVTDVQRIFDRHRERLAPLFDARLIPAAQYSEVQWEAESQGTAHSSVSFRGIDWEILLVANRAFYEHYTDAWPEASLIIGVLFAIMIGGLLRTIELKRASMLKQHELLNELSYQKAAIDQHAIVAVTDPSGHITYANDQFCEISGYSLEELLGRTHAIVNSGYHPKSFFTELWRVISSGRTWHGNICNRRKDGSLYWVSTTIVPFKSVSGKILRYVAVRSDITKIVEHDSKLEALNTELARSNEEMAHFTHTVSHDLKSPLISIRGFLGRVRDELNDGRTTDAIGMLDRIDTVAGGMYETISDLLSLCRIGREDTEPGACDLRAVIDHVISQHRAQIEEQGALVTVGKSLPRVWGDQVLVTQVMQNLITNALKYGHKPDQVSVVRIDAVQNGDEVLITVEDDGPGIDPKNHKRVFELFHRLERGCEGTGVGLAIVQRIVELQGGRVWIESDLGAGTRFCVAWPIAESAALAA